VAEQSALVRDMSQRLRGAVVGPQDAGYDALRRVWNARVDGRPAAVAQVVGAADVAAALLCAREHDIPISVRGTGHHVAGLAVREGGLVIDFPRLWGVRVDPVRRTARVEPGATWGDVDRATQAAGLAVTGGRISCVGVAGLTLGGGYGWLMRRCGLTVDNLLAADVVTADGGRIRASAHENPDLLWGLRGGGGNLGIVTAFEYRLHHVGPQVTAGAVFYDLEHLPTILRGFRALMEGAPDELGALCNVVRLPPAPFVPPELRGRPAVAIAVCNSGRPDAAADDVAVLDGLAPPLLKRIAGIPYVRAQRLFDAAGRAGSFVHGAAGQLARLDDAVCAAIEDHAEHLPSSESIVMISAMGGAVGRVPQDATAFSHRDTAFSYALNAVWTDPAEAERHLAWADRLGAALAPFTTGVYVNELGPGGDVATAYAPATLKRLRGLKSRFDPDNVFDGNHNVTPAPSAQDARAATTL
jgi:FAD/FMN-containing dehydrogenase